MTGYVEPAPHEFAANYIFDVKGLTPYFAADSQVKAGDGSQRAEFNDQGERWTASLSTTSSSNIVNPGSQLPTGTEWRLQKVREFELKVKRHSEEDPVGQQSFHTHLTPRWQGMEVEKSDGTILEYSVPDGIHEAVNLKIQVSNIDLQRYLDLLHSAALAVGIRADYFEKPHEYSNIQDAERYVRVHKGASGPVHARDGPIASMGHLLESDRQGYRKVVQKTMTATAAICRGIITLSHLALVESARRSRTTRFLRRLSNTTREKLIARMRIRPLLIRKSAHRIR